MNRTRKLVLAATVLGALLPSEGCALGSASSTAPITYERIPFRASDFVDPKAAANKWFPLTPGTQLVKEGTTLIGNRKVPYQVITTVTDVVRVIDGVKTVLVYDYELGTGQVTQRSLDYVAQDRIGNLWIMGGATESWEAGRFVEVGDVWMSGVDGARAGILMPRDLTPRSPAWVIAQHGHEESVSRFVTKQRVCVPFGCFSHVLVTREGTTAGPDNEFKYFAQGLGQIRNEPRRDSRHDDTEMLVNATRLSPEGLAAASADALQIDRRAAKAFPHFYGTQTAIRAS
ncbi:MAG: hypothetical protein M3130_03595 [Actinomycetota bacterium]|nr:hypothetical protein [Actinomycetota bacterium]